MEELKLVMEALVQLGHDGKEAFIWFLVVKYGLQSIAVIALIVGLLIAIRIVVNGIVRTTAGNALGSELHKILKCDTNKPWENDFYREEVKATIIYKVRALVTDSQKPADV